MAEKTLTSLPTPTFFLPNSQFSLAIPLNPPNRSTSANQFLLLRGEEFSYRMMLKM